MSLKKISTSIAGAGATSLAWISVAFAAASTSSTAPTGLSGAQTNLTGVGGRLGNAGSISLTVLIGNVINVVLGLLGIIFIILLVWAGVMYMLAGGEKDKVTKATGIIRTALIGLVITVAAYAIANYVVQALVAATAT